MVKGICGIVIMILIMGSISALNETEICKDIRQSVITYGYDYSKILELNYSQADLNEYYFNHVTLCVEQNLTPPFPQRQYKEIIINDTICQTNDFFFDYTLPFPDFNVGDLSCGSLQKLNYFFELKQEESYSATSLRMWWVLGIFLMIVVFSAIKNDSLVNKMIKKSLKRKKELNTQ